MGWVLLMAQAQDLVNMALTFLAQPSGSIVSGLPDSTTEGSYVIASLSQNLMWLTEAQNRLCRLCVPILDIATVTVSAGQTSVGPYSTITNMAGRILHRPTTVSIGSNQLQATNFGFLTQANNYWFKPDPATGNPVAWVDSNVSILLAPGYTAAPTLTISGFFLPPPLSGADQTVDSSLDDYTQRAMAFYLAWMIASKNADNQVLAPRAPVMLNEFAASVKEIYTRLVESDPTLSGFFDAEPIDAVVQLMSQQSLRK